MYSNPPFHWPNVLRNTEDVLVKVSLLYKSIGPDPLHQIVLIHHVSCILHEQEQGLDHLWTQRNRAAVTQQNALFRIKAKPTKHIEVLCLQIHTSRKNFARNFPELWKDF